MTHGPRFMTASLSTTGPLAGRLAGNLDFVHSFVLARAVSGALRAALLHDEYMLQDPDLEDALCTLITGFLIHGRSIGPSSDRFVR